MLRIPKYEVTLQRRWFSPKGKTYEQRLEAWGGRTYGSLVLPDALWYAPWQAPRTFARRWVICVGSLCMMETHLGRSKEWEFVRMGGRIRLQSVPDGKLPRRAL